MSNLLWYTCLGVISTIPAVFAIYKKRHIYKVSTFVIFYIFSACITWIGEFTVLGVFNSYSYNTGIINEQWAQNLTGHLILNSTMYPAAATLVVAYSLRYGWISLIIGYFIFAEYLFVRLGLYEQHWWKYYMSVITIIIYIIICKKWFYKMINMTSRVTRAIIFYFVGFLIIHIPAPLLLLAGKQYYSLELINSMVGSIYRSSIIFIFIYHLVEVFIYVYFICILDKWYWKIITFILAFLGQSILAYLHILVFKDGWNLIYINLAYAISLSIFIALEHYTLRPKKLSKFI